MKELTIFDYLYKPFKITNTIRTIELFGGYGSQLLSLKYLGADVEQWKLCEWAVKSIQAYKDIHFTDDNTDYSKDLTTDELIEYLFNKGISSNYNEPMSKESIKRLGEKQLRTIYNNIKATHNLVNIQQVKGSDLEIVDKEYYTYLLTYSFPCQDISGAGLGKGFSDTSTRSGMLWEVERILKECKNKPQVLLMENVPLIHSEGNGNLKDFNKWILSLEEMGYKNYWQDLAATDYGIPQTRVRTFMVSLLGDYTYTFPQPIKLEKKLKDMLEDNVDEKYFLSQKMIDGMTNTQFHSYQLDARLYDVGGNIGTLTTSTGERCPHLIKDIPSSLKNDMCNKLIQEKKIKENDVIRHSYTNSRIKGDMKDLQQNNISPTLDTRCDCLGVCVNTLKIKNNTNKGYIEAEEGDGIDISSRMIHHRGTVQKGKAQTISTMGGENVGVVVNDR